MKPKVTFIGRVTKNAEVITPKGGKKPFISYMLEGFPDASGWTNLVSCKEYKDKPAEVAASIVPGSFLAVYGDASAEAYMSKNSPGTPVGKICIFVKHREELDFSASSRGDKKQPPTSQPRTNPAAGRHAAPDQSEGQGDVEPTY